MTRWQKIALTGIYAFLAVFLIAPVLHVIKEAFYFDGKFSADYFWNVLNNPVMYESIVNSFMLAVISSVLATVLAIPLALFSVRYSYPFKTLLAGLLLIPLVLPPFVGAIGMQRILARFGSLNLLLMDAGIIHQPIDFFGSASFWGIVLLEVLHLYPIVYMNVAATMGNINPSLEEAASNLGSSRWNVMRKITLPLMMPGVFAGFVLVFILVLTDLGTPLVFDYRRVIAVQIFDRITDITGNPEGYALVVLVMMLTMLAFLLIRSMMDRVSYEIPAKGYTSGSDIVPGVLGQLGIFVFFCLIIALAILPHVSVMLTAFSDKWFMSVLPQSWTLNHFNAALGHSMTIPSIRNSVFMSLTSTVIDIVLGVMIAYLVTRCKSRATAVLDMLVMLPLAIPGLLLAFGYLSMFADTPLDPRKNPVPLLIIAYSIRRLPYMVRACHAGFVQINRTLEEAAENLGSARRTVMRKITLPLITGNIIAGAIMVFSFAMLEVSDSLMLAFKEEYYPITKAIFQLLGRIDDGAFIASALGVWSMVFLALSFMIAAIFMGKKIGQIFRA